MINERGKYIERKQKRKKTCNKNNCIKLLLKNYGI